MRTEEDKCGSCAFSRLLQVNDECRVACHRYPPTAIAVISPSPLGAARQEILSIFAQMPLDSWCGEFRFSQTRSDETKRALEGREKPMRPAPLSILGRKPKDFDA